MVSAARESCPVAESMVKAPASVPPSVYFRGASSTPALGSVAATGSPKAAPPGVVSYTSTVSVGEGNTGAVVGVALTASDSAPRTASEPTPVTARIRNV